METRKMTKKIYMVPLMEAELVELEEMLAGSGVTGDNGIEYGGTDDGSQDPQVKENWFIFREEW